MSSVLTSTQGCQHERRIATGVTSLEAAEPIFHHRVDKIMRMIRRILSDPADQEDILQQTFVNALAHLNSFRAEASLDTWLARIAINEALMVRRKDRSLKYVSADQPSGGKARALVHQLVDPRLNPEEKFCRKEICALISDALESLSPDFRTVVVMHDIEGLTCEQTASCLGLTVSATKSRLVRARRQVVSVLKGIFSNGHTKWEQAMLSRCLSAEQSHSTRRLDKSISRFKT